MSLTFYGVFATLFYTVLLGAIWPTRSDTEFSTSILDLIAKSLWLSWLVVVASYFLNLSNLIKPLSAGVWAAVIIQYVLRRGVVVKTGVPLALAAATGLSLFLFFGGFVSDYRWVFVTNDAVASWNRWAIELSHNQYRPASAAYPILFPGIWSLIYKAQQDASVWIFAKLSLFLLVFILTLLVYRLLSCGLVLCAMMLAGMGGLFLIYGHSFQLLNGDMDMPVSVMILAACVSMLVALHQLEHSSPQTWDAVILAALFTGLAALTKQPGIVLLVPLGMLLGFAWWSNAIGVRTVIFALVLALLPLATFLAMFLPIQTNPVGNLKNLQNLTLAAAESRHPLQLAGTHLLGAIPVWALVTMVSCSLLSVINIRRMSSLIGLALLALGVVGFFQYAVCCAYDERNVWWTITLILGSALLGLKNVDGFAAPRMATLWPAAYVRGTILALSILVGWAVSSRVSDATVSETQVTAQFGMLGSDLGPMLKSHFLPIQRREDVLISEMNVVGWTPGLVSGFQICGSTDFRCFTTVAQSHPEARIFVLIVRGLLEYPVIAHLLAGERIIGKARQYELHGPFTAGELIGAGP